MLPCEVLELPASEYDLLQRYWLQEPWGPWRDNLHAALIARTTLKAGGFKVPKLDVFMLKSRNERDAEEQAAGKGFVDLLKAVAVRKRRAKKK
jgi:hypothetical protein